MVEQLQFWPIGIDPDSDPEKDWPFGESKRTLVISPFLSGTALTDLARQERKLNWSRGQNNWSE